MKKKLIASLVALAFVNSINAQLHVDMSGTDATLDTIESYQIGPGTTYTQYSMTKGSKQRNVFLVDVDLTNPYNKVENVAAYNSLGRTETMANMYKRLDAENHRMLGGVNCNFWCVGATITANATATFQYDGLLGQPLQGTATDGVMITEPSSWNRGHQGGPNTQEIGYLIIDKYKNAAVDDYAFDGKVIIGENEYPIFEVNRPRVTENTDQITLYNYYAYNTTSNAHKSRTGACTEVVVKVSGWSINENIECEVISTNTTGGTAINDELTATLQGFGNGGTFLSELKTGDKFTINLGMFSRGHGTRPLVDQMVAGNGFVLDADTLTWRNYGESYNYSDYPRPVLGCNKEGNRLYFLVAQKSGLYTYEMCCILKALGAYGAASMDGGGSAQVNVYGQNMFATTESTPRGVANAIWAVSTAPDDDVADSIAFIDNLKTIVSSYAMYTPKIRAYNQYGVLISNDYQEYTLTCEPATLGTISEDGKSFTAAATPGEGKLIVHGGNAVTSKPIEVKAGKVYLRLDSILTDKRDYAIEVYSTNDGRDYYVNPASVNWTIDDSNVCAITNGTLNGVANGKTTIHGELDGITDDMQVTVEIPTTNAISFEGFVCDTTYQVATSRGANVQIENPIRFFGCPDSVTISITSNIDFEAEYAYVKLHTDNEAQMIHLEEEVAANTPYEFTINIGDLEGANDAACFPAIMERLKFNLKKAKTKTNYNLKINKVIVYYPNFTSTGLAEISNDKTAVKMVYQNGQIYILKDEHIYNINGQLMK